MKVKLLAVDYEGPDAAGALRTITQKITERRRIAEPHAPPAAPSAVGDARLALQINNRWRSQLSEALMQLVDLARIERRNAWKILQGSKSSGADPKQVREVFAYRKGISRGLMASARQLRALISN